MNVTFDNINFGAGQCRFANWWLCGWLKLHINQLMTTVPQNSIYYRAPRTVRIPTSMTMDVLTNKIYATHNKIIVLLYIVQCAGNTYFCIIIHDARIKPWYANNAWRQNDRCAWNNATVNKMIVIYERINFRIFPIAALIRWSAGATRRGDDARKIDKARVCSRVYWIQNKAGAFAVLQFRRNAKIIVTHF